MPTAQSLETVQEWWPKDHSLQPHRTWARVDNSKLALFKRCPRRFLYTYLFGWSPDRPNPHLEVGSAVHLALDYLIVHRDADVSDAELAQQAFDVYMEAFSKVYPPQMWDTLRAKSPGNIELMLQRYVKAHRHDPWDPVFNEVPGSAPLTENRTLYGRVDLLVRRHDTQQLMVIDHKTASADSEAFRAQWRLAPALFGYLHMVLCAYPEEQVWGAMVNAIVLRLETGAGKGCAFVRPELRFTLDQQTQWLHNTNHWYTQLENNLNALAASSPEDEVLHAFPLNEGDCTTYASVCPFLPYCTGCTNPLALRDRREGQPPTGFAVEFWDPEAHETERVWATPDLEPPTPGGTK